MFDFSGKVVVITGAGAGIGEAAARAYAERGAAVVVNSITNSAKELAYSLVQEGRKALFVQADVSQEDEVKRLIEEAVREFGRIDVVVNCAGIVCGGTVEETELEQWQRVMEVNVTGTFLVCKYAIPWLKKSKGVIVNVSSLVAIKGISGRAAYSASKGAVLAFSRAMQADYIKDGVRINCICPGTVMSPSLEQRISREKNPAAARESYIRRQPLGRLGTPEEIAATILLASSKEVSFLAGAMIPVDGGGSL